MVSKFIWVGSLAVIPSILFLIALWLQNPVVTAAAGISIPLCVMIAFTVGWLAPKGKRKWIE